MKERLFTDSYVELLDGGMEGLNKRRTENPGTRPDLTAADLSDRELADADPDDGDFTDADIS